MKKNLVITIGRECGSSGRAIGRKLAESLGIKCYDKELLALAAKNSGLCEELFKTHDEKPTNSFLYSLVMDTYSMGYNTSAYMDMPINHKIFLAQFDTIKKLADEESCVMKRHNITRDKAKDVMIKTDKQRSGYYNYYSSKRWGSSKSYNLCINSSVVGIDGAVEIIKEFAKKKQEFLKINENA